MLDPEVGNIGFGPAELRASVIFKLTLLEVPLVNPGKIL
jgi:hypothetical protein